MSAECKVTIITDRTTDLSLDSKGKDTIKFVEAGLTLNGEDVPNDLSSEKYLSELGKCRESDIFPKTAALGSGPFLDVIPDKGEAIIITPAKFLSRINEDARVAARDKPNVWVVEGITSAINGMLVRDAMDKADAGESGQEIAKYLEEVAGRMRVVLALNTVDYLKAGGRANGSIDIQTIALVLGSMLKLKPVLEVNRDGFSAQGKRVRSRNRKESLGFLKEAIGGMGKLRRGVMVHTGAEEEATRLAQDQDLLRAIGLESVAVMWTNLYVISHLGPGAVAFCGEME